MVLRFLNKLESEGIMVKEESVEKEEKTHH